MTAPPHLDTRFFKDDGKTPNNPTLPVVLMRHTAAADEPDPAAWFESRFSSHGWGACWRWGVYPYHHFHPDNHEVLGVFRGEATLMLGGANGEEFHVRPGDVIILPAGTGHKCQSSSGDFQVVGAYPDGMEPDLFRSGETELERLRHRIGEVAIPKQDPVFGEDGPLFEYWPL